MTSTIFKHLDEQVRILSFSVSDLIGYAVPFFIGALFDSLFVIPVVGILVILSFKRLLRRFPKFYGIRLLYWMLPTHRFNRIMRVNFPESHKRFWMK
jgi:type IV conjugative transfer system protein TraL